MLPARSSFSFSSIEMPNGPCLYTMLPQAATRATYKPSTAFAAARMEDCPRTLSSPRYQVVPPQGHESRRTVSPGPKKQLCHSANGIPSLLIPSLIHSDRSQDRSSPGDDPLCDSEVVHEPLSGCGHVPCLHCLCYKCRAVLVRYGWMDMGGNGW